MSKFDILALYRAKNTVFTTKEIALLWQVTNRKTLKARINYYVQRGKLFQLRRGIYVKERHNYDRLELATRLYAPSYISLETVLQQEGVVFQHYTSIFAVSYLSRATVCDGQRYVFKRIKEEALLNPLGVQQRETYWVATKERAVVDILYLYGQYYFDNLRSIDWKQCYKIAEIYSNTPLLRRLKELIRAYA